jgi:hypothetical protein
MTMTIQSEDLKGLLDNIVGTTSEEVPSKDAITLIVSLPSTEIFSKRRKIFSFYVEEPEITFCVPANLLHTV